MNTEQKQETPHQHDFVYACFNCGHTEGGSFVPATELARAVEDFRRRAVEAMRALSDNQLNRTMICARLQSLPATTEEGVDE